VLNYQSRGAQIRHIDLVGATADSLKDSLAGIDTVVCALTWDKLSLQWPLIDAAKAAGVKRFVPTDWGTPCVRGVRALFEQASAFPNKSLLSSS